MIRTIIFPGRYVQGCGAIEELGKELKKLGSRAFGVVDKLVLDQLLPAFRDNVEKELDTHWEEFGGESSQQEIDRLVELARERDAEVVAGIGGGKTIDTAKAVAHAMKAPVAVVPTLASTDAPCSALSVIYTAEGAVERYLFLPSNPQLVLVDTQIIADAPVRFLVAGMGDALATWFEAEQCRQSYAANMSGKPGAMTAYALAELCYQTLLEDGVAAKSACEVHAVTPALERIVEANTLLSGIGFESGGLAACHAVHNGLATLKQTKGATHGDKVAIGVLTQLMLTGEPHEIIDQAYSFCEMVGLPTTLAEIGLEQVSDDDLMRVAERTASEDDTAHNLARPVTRRDVFAALKAADAEGRRRKLVLAE